MASSSESAVWVVVGRVGERIRFTQLAADGERLRTDEVPEAAFPDVVSTLEAAVHPRWVWSACGDWYARLVAAGVRVARCRDLRLTHAILRTSALVTSDHGLRSAIEWDAPASVAIASRGPTLFDLPQEEASDLVQSADAALTEFQRQQRVLADSANPGSLQLLLAAESAGGLIAVELNAAGVPWDVDEHQRLLAELLGRRGEGTAHPERMRALAERVRSELADPALSLDSQPKLLRGLHRRGILVESTSKWELGEHKHSAIEPLLEYKRLARLYTANGWAWLEEWVREGRFRPVYVPGGVVTGRWASSGGGALQLPRQLRRAVRADPGWTFVVADVAQLEPRVLAAMSRDTALADAARGKDLYQGIVETGALPSRQDAKLAILGAMYGATTGNSARLIPRLRRTFPRAMKRVDDAAAVGESGGVVSTWLGRSCPPPDDQWAKVQAQASGPDSTGTDETHARRIARDRGRFTRNFVVQGTAAEWALAWLAEIRTRLAILPKTDGQNADASGPLFRASPHLAFFLHDEVIVHTPLECAEQVADAVRAAADAAAKLLFGDFPLDFLLDIHIADIADK